MTETTSSHALITDEPCAFVDLSEFVNESDLVALDEYMRQHIDLMATDRVSFDGQVGLFTAKGYKHGDAINLTDRDTSSWCADAFTAYTTQQDFEVCRAHRSDAKTWRPNQNAHVLPGVLDFLNKLPFFTERGKISIICNAPMSKGVEHADIEMDNLVSEFVWIRPPSSRKKFYVKDAKGKSHFVTGSIAWFDDHLLHNIEPSDELPQCSIRVDGRFKPEFRTLLCEKGLFASEGLREILENQQDGPAFLNEVNDYPESSDDEDDNDGEEE